MKKKMNHGSIVRMALFASLVSGSLFGLFLARPAAAKAAAVVSLEVEYKTEPIGIDARHPRFSWTIAGEGEEAMQAAYRLLVAESLKDLAAEKNLVWDSGKVKSSQSVAVPYDGPPLQSFTRYYWKVKVWPRNGENPVESEPGWFITGLMRKEELSAKWIWEDEEKSPNDYAFFRKSFELPAKPAEAYALVSAHNHYVLFINGKRVSGFVNPATSNPYVSKYYLVYSIAEFLKPGRNVIAAMAHYNGVPGESFITAEPGFLFEARIRLPGGKELMLGTGEDWKVLPDTPYDESAPFLGMRQHTAAEFYDARKEPGGWLGNGYDDSAWPFAVSVARAYPLRAQLAPESRVTAVVDPVKVRRTWAGTWLFDFGREYSGWVAINNPPSRAGQKITLRYSDRLFLGRASRVIAMEFMPHYADRYIAGRGNYESWHPAFGYRGFRFVEVSGLSSRQKREVKLEFARTELRQTASFACSNPLINRIYEISVHNQAMNAVGQLVDCVHREQSQWHADAEIQSGSVFYTFYDPHLVRKTLMDLKAGQFPDGRLPANYPSMPPWQYYIPEWDLRYFPMLWRAYYYYNDLEILVECWPAAVKLLGFFEKFRDETGLLAKSTAWHINDWPEDYQRMAGAGPLPPVSSSSPAEQNPKIKEPRKYLLVENCLYYQALVLSARMARVLGKDEEAVEYEARAQELKAAINRLLFAPGKHAYLDCYPCRKTHQAASALALRVGVVPEEEVHRVLEFVKSKGFGSSVLLTADLIEMLYDYDEGGFAYELISREEWPGWGYMVKKGSGTTWESWYPWLSRSHAFTAYLQRLLISGVAGISPGEPGWETIKIRPHVEGLSWAEASLRTPRGRVYSRWEKNEKGLTLEVHIPGNTKAKICIPAKQGKEPKLTVNGTPVRPGAKQGDLRSSVRFLERESAYIDFLAGPGRWRFRAEYE